jgi:hypothetical protein
MVKADNRRGSRNSRTWAKQKVSVTTHNSCITHKMTPCVNSDEVITYLSCERKLALP